MEACRSPASTISTNERRMKAGRGAGRIFSVPQMIVKGGRGPGSVVSYLESFKRTCKDSGSGLRIKHGLKKTSRSSASSYHPAQACEGWYKFWKFRGTACAFSVLETYVEAGRSPSIQSYLLAKAQEGGTGSADVVSIQQMLRKLLEVM